jgi:CBS-domain-containing membrane protein
MSVDFVTVTVHMGLGEALALLVASDLTELCVVEESGRFAGIVTDFDLLKSCLTFELNGRQVGSLISRAVTLLSADSLMDQAVPLFREGGCSRAFVCRAGHLVGRLSRSVALKYLSQQQGATTNSPVTCPLPATVNTGHNSTLQAPEPTPRAPQFLSGSVLGGLCVDR